MQHGGHCLAKHINTLQPPRPGAGRQRAPGICPRQTQTQRENKDPEGVWLPLGILKE